jgi:hypothetical protein
MRIRFLISMLKWHGVLTPSSVKSNTRSSI